MFFDVPGSLFAAEKWVQNGIRIGCSTRKKTSEGLLERSWTLLEPIQNALGWLLAALGPYRSDLMAPKAFITVQDAFKTVQRRIQEVPRGF